MSKKLPLSSIMITKAFILATLTLSSSSSVVSGFAPSITPAQRTSSLHLRQSDKTNEISPSSISRATFLTTTLTSSAALWINSAQPSNALVKGNAPPPKKSASSEERKCRNVEECQEQAERAEEIKAQQEAEKAAANPPKVTSRGTNYLDIVEEGSTTSSSDKVARDGDTVEVHYKVLKLGKRSYDGLSGEGTVVFSRGYALEDDEKVIGDHSFKFTLGDNQVISALNDAVPGMAVGALRRISVTPQNGWEKNTKACDGGPGGSGAGGSLKTDYVVVPTATMVEQEACFDKNKLPFPLTYAQERRMAQRFDQSLIIEVRLVNVV